MGHGSRHRRSDAGRNRHERWQDGQQVAPTTGPQKKGGSRAAKFVGATVAVSLAAGLTAVIAGAADKSAAPTSLTVAANADTYVYQEYPGENRGSSTKLTASNQKNLHTRAYLRFSVSGVPAGVTPKAHLLLSSDRNQPSVVELHSVASNTWNAMTMTMRNAPSVGAVVATANAGAGQKSLDFDLSGVVKGDGDYSFAVVAPLADTVSPFFASEHGADGPQLSFTWDGAPGAPAPAPAPSARSTTPAPGLPSLSPLPPVTSAPAKPSTSPTSSSSAPVPPPAPPPSGGTMFGTSLWTGDGTTKDQALARVTAAYGRPEVVRVFYTGLPAAWPGAAGVSGGPVVVSFKANPKDVLSGSLDGQMSNWFSTAPRDRQVFWTYFHEPEDDIARGAFTAADYRAAWQHLATLADKAGNPRLRSNLVLMCWSLNPASHRNWEDYFAGTGAVDTLGWDCYNAAAAKGQYPAASTLISAAVNTSKSVGLPWGIAELGSKLAPGDSGSGRAAWLHDAANFSRANGAAYVTYFDSTVGGDFRLLDAPSKQAWREVIAS
jgi:hypothetical protein